MPTKPITPAGSASRLASYPIRPSTTRPLPDVVSPSWKAPTSGGSTGRPKLIVAGQEGKFDPDLLAMVFRMERDDCQLVPGPLYHNAPFSLSTVGLFMGHHLVVLTKFDAVAALDAIGEHGVNWMNLVPTMMLRMLRGRAGRPRPLRPLVAPRRVAHGGAVPRRG